MKRLMILALVLVIGVAAIIWFASFMHKNATNQHDTHDETVGLDTPAATEPVNTPVVTNKPDERPIETAEPNEDEADAKTQEVGAQQMDVSDEATENEDENVQYTYGDIDVHVAYDVRLTAYCGCEICCGSYALNRPIDEYGNPIVYTATGAVARQGVTVAVDPSFIPHGSYVYIQDPWSGVWNEYIATDTSPVTWHVDIYYDNHTGALNSGYGGWGTVYWSHEPIDTGTLV